MYRSGLDAKIETEIAANEGGIVCSDRRARLKSCITQKRAGDLGNHRQRLRDWPIPNSTTLRRPPRRGGRRVPMWGLAESDPDGIT